MKHIKWGIIGVGDVTEVKSGPAFNLVEGSELIAVMRRTTERAEDYARRHNVPKWYDSADELIHDPEVNAIYIATPPDSHAEYAIKALNAGKPVYVEKPMAESYEKAVRINETAKKTGIPLFVAYYRRSLSYFLKVKEIVDSGKLGKIVYTDIKLYNAPRPEDLNKDSLPWRVDPQIAGGGYFYDMACHQLDILDFILGPVKDVCGNFANLKGLYKAEDTVSATIVFENGILGSGSWCFVVNEISKIDQMEITGTSGKIIFSGFDFSPVVLETPEGIEKITFDKPRHIQQDMIRDVVSELQGNGKSPSDGISGIRTSWVMDKILKKI